MDWWRLVHGLVYQAKKWWTGELVINIEDWTVQQNGGLVQLVTAKWTGAINDSMVDWCCK
jgi:hypothetical protein